MASRKDISISVPVARTLEIQRIQNVIRVARIFRRAFPHAKFAIRSILVRRTRIELDDSRLGAMQSRINFGLRGLYEAMTLVEEFEHALPALQVALVGRELEPLARPRQRHLQHLADARASMA